MPENPVPHPFIGNPVGHFIIKPAGEKPARIPVPQSTGPHVKDLILVQIPNGRAVAAFQVVRVDQQARDRVRLGPPAQDQVVVGLVRVHFDRTGFCLDDALVDGMPLILDDALIQKAAVGMGRRVDLQRLLVDVLLPVTKEKSVQFRTRARPTDVTAQYQLANPGSEIECNPVDLCVPLSLIHI